MHSFCCNFSLKIALSLVASLRGILIGNENWLSLIWCCGVNWVDGIARGTSVSSTHLHHTVGSVWADLANTSSNHCFKQTVQVLNVHAVWRTKRTYTLIHTCLIINSHALMPLKIPKLHSLAAFAIWSNSVRVSNRHELLTVHQISIKHRKSV